MFVFSKIFQIALHPGTWVLALLALGAGLLWTRWRRAGRIVLTATVAFLLVVSVLPVGATLLAVLENRFPPVADLAPPVDGIIVLGGAVNQFITRARGQPSLTEGAERMTEFVALAKRFPDARLAFSGGSASLTASDAKEAEVARLFFAQMGLDAGRLVFEDRSRNTYENAVFSRRLLNPKPGERWVLVTSAAHMPRAVGVFRTAGWQPIPYPVDYQTRGIDVFSLNFNLAAGLTALATAQREWMGLVAYRLLGRTDALLPGPKRPAGQTGRS